MDFVRMIKYTLEITEIFLFRKISPFELNTLTVNNRIEYFRSEEAVNSEADVV
jgi:hypothetical protein